MNRRLHDTPSQTRRHAAAWLMSISGALCSSAVGAGVLQGTASYPATGPSVDGAVFEAVLQDTSRADAPAIELGRSQAHAPGASPVSFSIAYDESHVQPGRRYTVRATIRRDGQLLYTTDRIHSVLDGRNQALTLALVPVGPSRAQASSAAPPAQGLGPLPASWQGTLPGASGGTDWHLDLQPDGRYQLRMTYDRPDGPQSFDDIGRWGRDHMARVVLRGGREAPVVLEPLDDGGALRKLDTTGQAIESTHNDRLKRLPAFTPIEPQLFLSGLFSYMADAPNITLCVNQQRMPVAMEKQFPELQAAYRMSGVQPGQVALVSVEGMIAMRPSAEEGQPPRAALVVQRVVSISPQGRCPSPQASSPLRNTYWKLVRLGQHAAKTSPQGREAHIVLSVTEQRVSGSDGCNRLFGGFTVDGRQLRFGRLASTMMACTDGTGQEKAFMDALKLTARFQIQGQHLELLDARGRTLARLEAVALP